MAQNNVKRFQLLYFVMTLAAVHFGSFLFDYAREMGHSIAQAGVMLAICNLGSTVGRLFIGFMSDRLGDVKKVVMGSIFIAAIASVFLAIFQGQSFTLPITAFFIGFFLISLFSIVDTWVLSDSPETRANVGRIFAFSSLARTISAASLGFLFVQFGYSLLAYTMLITSILTMLSLSRLKSKRMEGAKKITLASYIELLKLKDYVTICIVCFLLCMGINSTQVYSYALIRNLGGTSLEIGLFTTICSGVEIFMFVFVQWLSKRVKSGVFLIIACLSALIHCLLLLLAVNPTIVLVVSVLYAVTMSFYVYATKFGVDETIPDHLKMTGHALGSAIFYGGATALNSAVAGALSDALGINTGLIIYAGYMVILACVLIYRQIRIKPKIAAAE